MDIRPSEVMWVEGAEGAKIQVFVVEPHDFDPNKKYPLVINVHGGPQMQWMNSFRADWQVYPGAGYVIAYPTLTALPATVRTSPPAFRATGAANLTKM